MHRMCEITQKYCDAVMFEEKVSILRNLLKMGIAEDNACDCTAIPEAQRAEALALAKGDMVSATNYDAIIKMQPDHMEHFLDQVYLTGLNTGMYAATNDDDSVLDDNPFDATWLAAEAEKATAMGFVDDGDEFMLNALTEAVLRSAGIMQNKKEVELAKVKVVEVKALPDHMLWLRFNTGEEKVFDFKPLLTDPAFAPLDDPEIFNDVSLDHGVTIWNNGDIDIAPSYLYNSSTGDSN